MKLSANAPRWWGPPKKFDQPEEERRISWLELFFDLVYVIAISRITHHFAQHVTLEGFLEYISLFIMIFWGWLNGSLYHDMHGNEGLRTRLMTLWQMMIIAALAITIGQTTENRTQNITIVLMMMQLYITYLWWSVGFYDRSHRRYNRPYTLLYLAALALMGLSLVVPPLWMRPIIVLILIFNFSPPFISHILLTRDRMKLSLSSSMVERMGLFTIIVFGEVVLGVVNGIGNTEAATFHGWLNFALSLAIVFALWWLFFTLIANRQVKTGFLRATLIELLYVPALIALGLIAVSFSSFFNPLTFSFTLQKVLGLATATFLISISLMLGLLHFPKAFSSIKRSVRISLFITALVFFVSAFINFKYGITYYLTGIIFILVAEITYLNSRYYMSVNSDL
ncbi:MAG: low temperature requirement protein A [Bacteroidales bacterium]|nr:low temperature requirement protein A [Bacteroidales bacterium]